VGPMIYRVAPVPAVISGDLDASGGAVFPGPWRVFRQHLCGIGFPFANLDLMREGLRIAEGQEMYDTHEKRRR